MYKIVNGITPQYMANVAVGIAHGTILWNSLPSTVKREMLVAIIFGGFENITIWLRFNLAISLKESVWGSIFFQLVTTNFGEIYYFANFAK